MTSSLASLATALASSVANVQSEIKQVQTQLATGVRTMNAAETGIVTRLSAQVSGYKAIQSNFSAAKNTIGVAQTALTSIASIITQLQGLATKASSAGLTSADRAALNTTFQTLKTQISSLAENAAVNGSNLLAGFGATSSYAYVANSGSNTISEYSVGADGTLTPIGTVSTPPQTNSIDLHSTHYCHQSRRYLRLCDKLCQQHSGSVFYWKQWNADAVKSSHCGDRYQS